tara:strand:+ start:1718 stop:2074 length:357 start_codon:yes stop_codon:yes gene_type:complete
MNFRVHAILELRPNAQWSMSDDNVLRWKDTHQTQPTEDEIQAKIAELQAAEPLRQLRIQRNQLLQQTDWRMTSDYPYDDQAEWASYRTSLRNLPATAEPTLSESGELIVDWPTAPDQK